MAQRNNITRGIERRKTHLSVWAKFQFTTLLAAIRFSCFALIPLGSDLNSSICFLTVFTSSLRNSKSVNIETDNVARLKKQNRKHKLQIKLMAAERIYETRRNLGFHACLILMHRQSVTVGRCLIRRRNLNKSEFLCSFQKKFKREAWDERNWIILVFLNFSR